MLNIELMIDLVCPLPGLYPGKLQYAHQNLYMDVSRNNTAKNWNQPRRIPAGEWINCEISWNTIQE